MTLQHFKVETNGFPIQIKRVNNKRLVINDLEIYSKKRDAIVVQGGETKAKITITDTNITLPTNHHGIRASSKCTFDRLENLHITSHGADGLHFNSSSRITVEHLKHVVIVADGTNNTSSDDGIYARRARFKDIDDVNITAYTMGMRLSEKNGDNVIIDKMKNVNITAWHDCGIFFENDGNITDIETVNINSENSGIYFKNKRASIDTINDLKITSNNENGIHFQKGGDIKNINILHIDARKRGIYIADGLVENMRYIDITAHDDRGIDIRKGGIESLKHIDITSASHAVFINNGNKPYGKSIQIDDANITSTNERGINVVDLYNIEINNTTLSSTQYAIYIDMSGNSNSNIKIKNSKLTTSKHDDGILIEKGSCENCIIDTVCITDVKKGIRVIDDIVNLTITNSGIKNSTNYALDIQSEFKGSGYSATINNNCLSGDYLAYLKNATNVDFDGNYWDGVSDTNGDGKITGADSSKIDGAVEDNAPLLSCPQPDRCGINHVPIADYRMDKCEWDGTSGEVIDSSGHGYDGTAKNGANTEDNVTAGGGLCHVGKFDGMDDYIDIGQSVFPASSSASQISISAWIKPTSFDEYSVVAIQSNASWRRGFGLAHIYDISSKSICFYIKRWNRFYVCTDVDFAQWTHVVGTYDGSYIKIYKNKTLVHKYKIGNRNFKSNDNLLIGDSVWRGSGSGSDLWHGEIDELKIYDKALTNSEISQIYDNEKAGKNYNDTNRICQTCASTQTRTAMFNAVSSKGPDGTCNASDDWDNNLTTQIVHDAYTLYILAEDINASQPMEANITEVSLHYFTTGDRTQCSGSPYRTVTLCSGSSCGQTDASGCLERHVAAIRNDRAVKCVQVHIEGFDANATGSDLNESNSTDNYAIRPETFKITPPTTPTYAGENFDITFEALDLGGNNATDYNETKVDGSFTVDYNETKPGCKTGILDYDDIDFTNGLAQDVDANYSEVGEVNITIREIVGSEFAKVDGDDTPEADRLIMEADRVISVDAHHFELNATMQDFDVLNRFTYLSRDLNMSASIDIDIAAKNKQNETTENFIDACYAKDVDIAFRHSAVDSDHLDNLLYYYTDADENDSSVTSTGKNDMVQLTYPKANFSTANSRVSADGTTKLTIRFNFDRNASKPVEPFDQNITYLRVMQGSVNSVGYENTDGNATFYYGRLVADDLFTSEDMSGHFYRVEVYAATPSDTHVADFNRTSVRWYINKLHDTIQDGNVSACKVTVSSRLNEMSDSGVTVAGYDDAPDDGVNPFTVSNVPPKRRVIHLDASPWLWYVPEGFGGDYLYDESDARSDCTRHPCFIYTRTGNGVGAGVSSGAFSGSDFGVRESNVTRRGVKVFR